MMKYFITPTNENRTEKWEKVYGRSHLPVKYSTPQVACTQRWGDVAVYYLDTTAVPEALLDRLATFEARRLGISYPEARMAVRQEWLIKADGCQLQKEVPVELPPAQLSMPFLHTIPFRPRKSKLRLKPARKLQLQQA
ncbi:MAG: hypothetical protein AAF614_43370 [Chloroflexota bacterium]